MNEMTQAYLLDPTSSFSEFVARTSPNFLPGAATGSAPHDLTPTATTIVAVATSEGVVLAGDRRATMGSMIAQRDIQKVFVSDDHSAIGIAGSAGIAIDLAKLFRVELEHYEKIEGAPLTLDGKANRLASMIRSNLGMALQGFVVVPLFVGWDAPCGKPRIFTYDATGGCYEELGGYQAIGSGSLFAKGSLKKLYNPAAGLDEAMTVAIHALFDAADDDSATGGPDVYRRIYPVLITVDASGASQVSEDRVADLTQDVLKSRATSPDGPKAGVR
ncbi:MAG: proteasome subunit beta [Propionibacteriaceae bacterium]|jgi:proteasome beta subunit|nr:proteasome subunit beta [Propionibacteriaceae bacterium]